MIEDEIQQPIDRAAGRIWPRLRIQLDWSLIGLSFAIKGLIFLVGAFAFMAFADRPITSARDVLAIWNRWDAPHYLDLAQYGYHATDVGEIRLFLVFYPLFPWLTRLAAWPFGDVLIGAFIVSTVASLAAVMLMDRLVALDHPPDITQRALWFFLIFPTSYFLHIGYTESLFIALMLGCFLAARHNNWLLAGVLGAFACLTRVNGLVLIPALAAEAAYQWWHTRRWQWQWLWIVLISVGFGGYLLLNWQVTGDPFRFLQIQHDHWYKSLTWPWNGIRETIRSIFWRPPAEAHMLGIQELIFIVISLIATIAACLRLRPSYGVWMAGNWLLCTSTSFIMSTPRYVLILFPMFIVFAQLAGDRRWLAVITAWSLLFMGMFVSLFVQGKWAF